MIQLATPIPRKVVVASSGGPDSQALLSFCRRGKKDITVLHIDHGTDHAKQARAHMEKYCADHNLPLVVREVPADTEHNENVWREFRLECYREFTSKGIWLATGHHAGDNLEWHLLTTIHGKPNFMRPRDEEHKLLKPFLLAEKEELIAWCERFNVPYVNDPTNIGQDNARAKLRADVIPALLNIHKGMKSSIRNKFKESIGVK